jgi:lipoyl-dependent peroxiredoxin
MATERSAICTWTGELVSGHGDITFDSGAVTDLPVTWASRTSEPGGLTSPEELVAAAHASCFSMALTHGLSEAGFTASRLEVSSTVTLDQVDGIPTITTSDLVVEGLVPDIDAATFIQVATDAGKNCPMSRALGPLEISVTAMLVDSFEYEGADDDDDEDFEDEEGEEGFEDPASALDLEEGREFDETDDVADVLDEDDDYESE